MSTMPTPAPEQLAEGKPDDSNEISSSIQNDTQKEAVTKEPSLDPTDEHLKPTTPTTTDEDASGVTPAAEQAQEKTTNEKSDSMSHTTENLADSGTIEGSDNTQNPTAGSTVAKVDPKQNDRAQRRKDNKASGKEEFSDDDSQDGDAIQTAISEEDQLVHTAEGQAIYKKRAPKRIKQFEQYFWTVEYRLGFFEKELKKLKGDDIKSSLKDDAEKTNAASPEIIPGIRRLTWADFKPSRSPQETSEFGIPKAAQRFTWEGLKVRPNLQNQREPNLPKGSGDQYNATPGATIKPQHHVLEVLIEDPGTSKRRRVKKRTDDENPTKLSGRNTGTFEKGDAITAQNSKKTLQCPERVRICSRPIQEILRKMLTTYDPDPQVNWHEAVDGHIVFLRPFKIFVLYETELRDALKDLEKNWHFKEQIILIEKASDRKTGEQDPEANDSKDAKNEESKAPASNAAKDSTVKTDTLKELQHLRLLVEFLDTDLKSTFDLRKQISAKKACPIAFADLWHLYEHGQEVRTPENKLQIFKVAKFTGGRDLLVESLPSSVQEVPSSCIDREESNGAFFIECYRYDFNGIQYGPVHKIFEIRRYEGLRDITSLQVYPWCFDGDYLEKRLQLVQRGEKFMALARTKKTAHRTCCGVSLDEHTEEVESQVILDFPLAVAKGGIQIPQIGFQSTLDYDPRETIEDSGCIEGCQKDNYMYQDHRFDQKLSERFLADQKPHLAPVKDPEELGEDEAVLFPYTVHGFVLRSRKWRTFNLDDVEDVKYSNGFDDLVLPPGHKETVEALVNRHSSGNNIADNRTEAKRSMDLVTGKGKGLIILLHGAPGVGKTSTAECVADKTQRPLFPITCGDLGESAMEVEESLEMNFSLAHRWGCVLLLDEADVFLTVRNQTDLRRNAVVSVFLRTLEYYSGILFLTTNRVGTLDPAFKSRIHISLHYPKLGRKATSEIWRNHIEKAKEYFEQEGGTYLLRKREIIAFSKQHFKTLKDEEAEPWNGRQIRNAFQTAIALAEHEAYINGGKPELTDRHFRKVAEASSEFDKYLRITHGRSESQLAEQAKIRTDDLAKAERRMAAITQRQRLRGQPKSEDDPSDTDSSEDASDNVDDSSSSEETPPPPKVSKKPSKKKKTPSENETPPKKSKERAKRESTSEEEAPVKRKSKKEKSKPDSTSEEETPPPKKGSKKEKEKKKKKKDLSSDEEQESSEEEKEPKKPTKETKGKEKEKEKDKAKTTSKSFN